MSAELKRSAAQAKAWLFDAAFPLWLERGLDRSTGLFVEKLNQDGTTPIADTRVRVQARQTFTFAMAGRLGWSGDWREAVHAGINTLIGVARGDELAGVVHKLSASGEVIDARQDLYDQAFFLFSLGHAVRSLGGHDAALAACDDMLEVLASDWRRAEGGYHEGAVTPCPPFRQNPHMHSFEAFLALYETTHQSKWLEAANAMGQLFQHRLYQPRLGVMPEFFDQEWQPLAGPEGRIIEPGHQFEWAWLLHDWARCGGPALWHQQESMIAFAEGFGVNRETGAVYDECWDDGSVKTGTSRLWPHTERIKAGVVLFERTGDELAARSAVNAFDTLMKYADVAVNGLYLDRMRDDGSFIDEPATASSLYHIVMGCSELIRVAER